MDPRRRTSRLVRFGCARHDAVALARTRAEDPVVANQMEAGRRDQGRELFDELLGLEDDVGRAVAPAMLEPVEKPPVLHPREALGGDRRAGDVATEALESAAIAGGDGHVRVQADAAHAGAALAFEGRQIVRIDAIAHAQHALARSAARGDAAGDGGAVELRQQRLVLGQGIDLRGIGLGAEAPALEEPRDAPGDLPHHPLDLGVLGRRQGMEAQHAVRLALVDAVEQQRVEVDVQVQRVAEALHEGDRAALAADHAPLPARTSAEGCEDSPHEDTNTALVSGASSARR